MSRRVGDEDVRIEVRVDELEEFGETVVAAMPLAGTGQARDSPTSPATRRAASSIGNFDEEGRP